MRNLAVVLPKRAKVQHYRAAGLALGGSVASNQFAHRPHSALSCLACSDDMGLWDGDEQTQPLRAPASLRLLRICQEGNLWVRCGATSSANG